MPDNPLVCSSCRSNLLENYLEITVRKRGIFPEEQLRSLSHSNQDIVRRFCKNPQCLIDFSGSLAEPAREQLDKNKTNAVGPLARGAPGAAFNEHFETPADKKE